MQLKYLFCVNRCVIFSSQCVQRKGKRRSLRSSQKFLQKILCSKWVNTAALRHHVLFKSRRPANIHVHAHHHYYRWTAMRRGFIAAAVFDRHAHNIRYLRRASRCSDGRLKNFSLNSSTGERLLVV